MISVLEFLPQANEEEFELTKYHLENYQDYKEFIKELEGKQLTNKQIKSYDEWVYLTENIERAVRLIKKKDIRNLVELRYLKGLEHKTIVLRFNDIDPSTIDRRMNRGIQCIANTLKFLA
jgi:hypothetical protein